MFTALKRISNSKHEAKDLNPSSRPTSMSTNLQKKFSKGVQYNMKIIIKGDSCTGKTSVFRRLQGKNLEEEYRPTEGIQAANVHWNYKNVDDVVKVEVWDVVDKGRKIAFNVGEPLTASLDAEFLDVYKGTNGVILVMDVTKNWTFSYVQNELAKIPLNVPVLILGNRCDMGHHRKISSETVQEFIDSVQRTDDEAQIKYTESSMVNGFGLKYIYKFLALPFLQLQRSVLKSQLDRNAEEIKIALSEIDLFQTSDDGDYGKFSDQLSLKRRKKAEHLGITSESSDKRTPSVIFGLGCPINRYAPFRKTPQVTPSLPPIQHEPTEETRAEPHDARKTLVTVEEFVPGEESLDDNFFQEPRNSMPTSSDEIHGFSDTESQEDPNPLVAEFQEDVDPNDNLYACTVYSPILEKATTVDKGFRIQGNGKTAINPHEISTYHVTECGKPSDTTTPMEVSQSSEPEKKAQSMNGAVKRKPEKATKKNRKSRGGKHSEDPNATKDANSQRKKNKEQEQKGRSFKERNEKPEGSAQSVNFLPLGRISKN